jgi:SHAQKYF class myb-like DNA-binding protein
MQTNPPSVLEPPVSLNPEHSLLFFKPSVTQSGTPLQEISPTLHAENKCIYKPHVCSTQKQVKDLEPQFPVKNKVKKFVFYNGVEKKTFHCIKQKLYKKGRWSKDEHERFLLGLKILGKGKWVEIAEKFVITRSRVQVASHAQKFCLD